jgi:predicted DNA-binding antitoxin AbrB/MazE fold protein
MEKKLQAVYTGGVLRLEEPLQLKEMQQVVVTVSDLPAVDDDLTGYFTPEEWAKAARDRVTWEDVRQALSEISGCLSDTVTAQRRER